MNYGAIKKCDIANGEGVRVSLFVSGCRNKCKGCFQPQTWDFSYGKIFDDAAMADILSAADNSSIRGLTVLGGEPLEPENQPYVLSILRNFKQKYPKKTIWLYTGGIYENIIDPSPEGRYNTEYTSELLSLVDVLVDGPYIEEEKSLGLRFRGSKNQRIIDMKRTRENGIVTIWAGVEEDKHYENKNKEA